MAFVLSWACNYLLYCEPISLDARSHLCQFSLCSAHSGLLWQLERTTEMQPINWGTSSLSACMPPVRVQSASICWEQQQPASKQAKEDKQATRPRPETVTFNLNGMATIISLCTLQSNWITWLCFVGSSVGWLCRAWHDWLFVCSLGPRRMDGLVVSVVVVVA